MKIFKKLVLDLAFFMDKHFGWHNCEIQGNDGCSNYGICKYCGVKCLQDNQGNWFEV